MTRRLLAYGALLVGLAAGCPFSFTNDDHCAAQAGDSTCAAADPSTPYCALDGCGLYDEVTNRTGCVAEMPTDMACYSPCGGKLDANARSDCEAATGSSTVGPSTETDPSSSTTTVGDTESSTTDACGCGPDAPICLDGDCVACPDDAWCETEFEDVREVCFANDCVVCAPSLAATGEKHHRGCSLSMPNCTDEACTDPCLLPDDCPLTSCEHRYGVCGPTDRVLYVSVNSGVEGGEGSIEEPLRFIAEALDRVDPKASGNDYSLTTIFLAPGTYTEALELAGRTVILRPTDPSAARPVLTSPDTRPVFDLLKDSDTDQQAVLDVVGLRFEDSMGPVARVGPTSRFLADGVEMFGNAAIVEIERGQVFLRNSIVVGTTGPVLRSIDTGDFGVVASTIVENEAATWFDCSSLGENTVVTIRDSIVGRFDGTAFGDLITPECALLDEDMDGKSVPVTSPVRTVTGADVEASAFLLDGTYRLDNMPAQGPYVLEDAAFCPEGSPPAPTAKPCPPRVDIDGKDRLSAGNWVGASVP